MQNIPFLIKLNVLHMNRENKTDCATNSQKQAQVTNGKEQHNAK